MVMLFRTVHMDKKGYIHVDNFYSQDRSLSIHVLKTSLIKQPLKTKFQSLLVKIQGAVTENMNTILESEYI